MALEFRLNYNTHRQIIRIFLQILRNPLKRVNPFFIKNKLSWSTRRWNGIDASLKKYSGFCGLLHIIMIQDIEPLRPLNQAH